MTVTQFREMAAIRVEIEGFAAELAAKASTPDSIEIIVGRRESVPRRSGRNRRPDLPRAVALNKDFHFAVYDAPGCRLWSRSSAGFG